ncbi:MAG: hypothetical protein ACP5I6_08010 [Caldisphaera sp.]|nr:hypothetical protein [Caldisphaera sp.]
MSEIEFEVIEEYYLNGEHRFRLKEKKSGIIINIYADNQKEAAEKAMKIILNTKLKT